MALNVIYAGTPEFAVPALDALVGAGHRVVSVYTQPDRPAGRGRALQPSPVKERAQALGLPVEQPTHLKDPNTEETLRRYAPDVMIVAAYGLLLPAAILQIPRLGCINIHASLLPRWRGAAPIQRALLAGDAQTGVAIMRMEEGLDTGPVYVTAVKNIDARDTTTHLTGSLAELGARTLVDVLPAIAAGQLFAVPQPEVGVMYAKKIVKAEALIDWARPAAELERAIRAFQPWPVAETRWRGGQLRIHAAQVVSDRPIVAPGTILRAESAGIDVATGDEILRLTHVQMAGRAVVSASQFVQGESQRGGVVGQVFGATQ
jgi:methionyl-tRNA formyltransferase